MIRHDVGGMYIHYISQRFASCRWFENSYADYQHFWMRGGREGGGRCEVFYKQELADDK